MKTVPAAQFKAQCLSLLDRIGPEGIVITKHGKPVAKLVPFESESEELDELRKRVEEARMPEEAAKAADALAAADPTTPPADGKEPAAEAVRSYDEKKAAFESAITKVLEANVDPNKLTEGVTINQVVQKEEELDKTIADVLATNLDIGKLQTVLEAKPGDAFREQELKKLTEQHPSMAGLIDGMVKATDQLRTQRRGEGRLEDPADLQRLLKGTRYGGPASSHWYEVRMTARRPAHRRPQSSAR